MDRKYNCLFVCRIHVLTILRVDLFDQDFRETLWKWKMLREIVMNTYTLKLRQLLHDLTILNKILPATKMLPLNSK